MDKKGQKIFVKMQGISNAERSHSTPYAGDLHAQITVNKRQNNDNSIPDVPEKRLLQFQGLV